MWQIQSGVDPVAGYYLLGFDKIRVIKGQFSLVNRISHIRNSSKCTSVFTILYVGELWMYNSRSQPASGDIRFFSSIL